MRTPTSVGEGAEAPHRGSRGPGDGDSRRVVLSLPIYSEEGEVVLSTRLCCNLSAVTPGGGRAQLSLLLIAPPQRLELAQPVVHRQRDVVRREVLIQPIEQPADDDSGLALDQRSRRSLRPMQCRRRAHRLESRAGTQRTA